MADLIHDRRENLARRIAICMVRFFTACENQQGVGGKVSILLQNLRSFPEGELKQKIRCLLVNLKTRLPRGVKGFFTTRFFYQRRIIWKPPTSDRGFIADQEFNQSVKQFQTCLIQQLKLLQSTLTEEDVLKVAEDLDRVEAQLEEITQMVLAIQPEAGINVNQEIQNLIDVLWEEH